MPDSIKNIGELIAGKFFGTLTTEQELELEQWAEFSVSNRQQLGMLLDKKNIELKLRYYAEAEAVKREAGEVLLESKPKTVLVPVQSRPFFHRWHWAAAALILVSFSGIYLWYRKVPSPESVKKAGNEQQQEIPAGKNGAVLILADGRQVVLDSLGNGPVATQGGGQVVLYNGQLSYNGTVSATGVTEYNAMQTPKGRQFNLRLPDGSMVWLNSASSVRYPVVFSGKERRVEITGEAYFEVVKNQRQPFIVSIDDRAEVEVLGTSFNVNAYDNEASIRTALLEGSVRVSGNMARSVKKTVVLKPGQLARITDPETVRVEKADADMILAWKNGAFNFNGLSLDEIMRQLERWYDIEVAYENGIPDIKLGGELSRDVTLADLLKGLKESELHFRIEAGRRLVILR